MVALRFFVAMGVGGEWAVASAIVAEVMPQRSRAIMSSIFHGSSVFGTLLAAAAGAYVVGNPALGSSAWRWGFAIGALPALLTLWVRWKLREPEQWQQAQQRARTDQRQQAGRLAELFSRSNLRATLICVTLSSIGLVTFWGAHIYGKNALLRRAQHQALALEGVPADAPDDAKSSAWEKHRTSLKRAEMLSMVLNTLGGGLGLVLFGAISNRLGRKGAFVLYHAMAFFMVLLLFQVLIPYDFGAVWLAIALPVFGFFTLGMHAGYAVYFPELYPTRLRGTGAGFCFNMGRLATAAAFFAFGAIAAGGLDALSASLGYGRIRVSQEQQALLLAPLYLLGVIVVLFARETRHEALPE